MEKVLVTGGAGFIGRYVVKELLKKGYEVRVVDNLSKEESKTPENVEFFNIDLTNKEKSDFVFKDVDYCINLASKIGGIGYFHKLPATILSENNKIYSTTFELAVKHNIKKMVYFSSSMVFESTNKFPSKEEDLSKVPPPVSSYGFSKLIGESYCRAYFEEYGLKYAIVRPFNAYGINEAPGDYVGYAHVIPDLVKKILRGDYPLELLGDGQQTRCFTHAKDIARGAVLVMESEHVNADFIIRTEQETKIIDLAKQLWVLCERKEPFKVRFAKGFKHDIKRRVPSCQKAKDLLGFQPEIKLRDGLKEYIDWYKNRIITNK